MNFYCYWFYIVHGFYYRFSKDFHFDILAIGLFSLIVSFLFLGTTSLIIITLDLHGILFRSPIPVMSFFIGLYLINAILFGPKQRQERLMTKFRQNQSMNNDIIAIVLTSLSVITPILAAILNTKN